MGKTLMGVVADCHGLPHKLRKAIDLLRLRGAQRIFHLGDVVDTLRPETVDECVSLLLEYDISGVMGNHEYSFIRHHFKRYTERFSKQSQAYVSSLPEFVVIEDVCLTHFSPVGGVYGLFAHTDDASYEKTIRESRWPVIINGHSHDPRIYRQTDGLVESLNCPSGTDFLLDPNSRYILTCGALEDSYCALYDFSERRFQVILISR